MVLLHKIVNFLDSYLNTNDIDDESWNGLQVEGNSEVKKILFAVDIGMDTINYAIKSGVELVVVHHGEFWKSANPSFRGSTKKRVDLLNEHKISLYASHLPLDRHKDIGNNSQLIKLLNGKIAKEFYFKNGKNIGWIGELKKTLTGPQIVNLLDKEINAHSKLLYFGKKYIKTVAVCSGGGGYPGFYEALRSGVDLYLSGDSIEIYHSAKDANFNVLFGGHHATETVGVKALSKIVEKKFKIHTEFVDIQTGF